MTKTCQLLAFLLSLSASNGIAICDAAAREACPSWAMDGSAAGLVLRHESGVSQPIDQQAFGTMQNEAQRFVQDNFGAKGPDDLAGDKVAERLRERFARQLPQYAADLRAMGQSQLADCTPGASGVFSLSNAKLKQHEAAQYSSDHPGKVLLQAYHDYIGLKACAKARAGYEDIYVTDEEVEDAKRLTKAIEDAASAKDPSIETDKLWAEADSKKLADVIDMEQFNSMNTQMRAFMAMSRLTGAAAVESGQFDHRGEVFCDSLLADIRSAASDLGITETHKKDF